MSAHTNGPWHLKQGVSGAPIVMAGEREIAKVLYHGGSEDSEVQGNARLINAAPGLLDALDGVRSALEFYVEQVGPIHEAGCPGDDTCECPNMKLVNDAWSKAEAALLKARGEHT